MELFRELRPEMQLQLALTFLLIAQHKGISAAKIAKAIGLSQSAASRNITTLCEGTKAEPGLRLAVKTVDPDNTRAHAIHLTAAGRAMAARVAEALAKAVKPRRSVEVKLREDSKAEAVKPAVAASEVFTAAHWEVWV